MSFVFCSTISIIFLSLGIFLFYFDYYQNYIWYQKVILFFILFIITTLFSVAQVSAIDALKEKGYLWKEAGRGDSFHAVLLSFIGYAILIFLIILTIVNNLNKNGYFILHIIFPAFYSFYPIFTYLQGYNRYLEDKDN